VLCGVWTVSESHGLDLLGSSEDKRSAALRAAQEGGRTSGSCGRCGADEELLSESPGAPSGRYYILVPGSNPGTVTDVGEALYRKEPMSSPAFR
jgi:hypothetical protein